MCEVFIKKRPIKYKTLAAHEECEIVIWSQRWVHTLNHFSDVDHRMEKNLRDIAYSIKTLKAQLKWDEEAIVITNKHLEENYHYYPCLCPSQQASRELQMA